MIEVQENLAKFKELILYICSKCADHARFGSVKLNKILFYADFIAFRDLGDAITGVEYQKLPKGPAPRKLKPVLRQMEADRELVIQPRKLWTGNIQKRPVNLRTAKLSFFSAEEISLVDSVIEHLKDLTADETSDASHEEIGWKAANFGETIPYMTAFISAKRPNALDIERAEITKKECAALLATLA